MKTEEAIRLLGKEVLEGMGIFNSVRLKVSEAQDIITLLQQGEKYQDIFETIVEWSTGDTITYNDLVDLEQKYFPKELPDDDKSQSVNKKDK